MNFRALKNNIIGSFQTTQGIGDAFKRLLWLYNLRPGTEQQIAFQYPTPIGNINLTVRSNNGSDVFIVSEVFEELCYEVRTKKDIRYIIDLGANAGFTSIYFSKHFPNALIACVEPMPNNVAILKRNLQSNKVNAIVKQAAISVSDGVLQMDISANDYGHKVHGITFGKDVGAQTVGVDAVSINSLLKELQWPQIDLLKIDIEGYEGILFSSNTTWLNKTNTIVMEIHEGVSPDEINRILSAYSFNYMVQRKGNWIFSKHIIE